MQIRNILQNIKLRRLKPVLKVVFETIFHYVQICYICKEKKDCISGLAEVLRLQVTKRLGPQIANRHIAGVVATGDKLIPGA
jgi:hypothetical protein